RDPQQSVPGTRVRHAARDRGNPGLHGAPDRRRERAARPAGRSRCARGCAQAARRRPSAGGTTVRRRARGVPGTGERGGTRRALALADRGAPLRRERTLLWTAIGAWIAGFTALSILRQDAFNSGRFDMGNMVQAVWATAHGHPLEVTSLQGLQISRLASHTDAILAVFAPLWWLWPSPDMLLTAQAIAVALGALPVFWLARKHVGSARAGLGFALAYLLYPATGWLTLNEFHPVALACPLLLFAFWYLDEERWLMFAAFALAAATTKEEIPLVLAGFGVWYAITRRRWGLGGA